VINPLSEVIFKSMNNPPKPSQAAIDPTTSPDGITRPPWGFSTLKSGAEHTRLEEDAARTVHWKHWGPYLSERQWGTVREDYSANGDSWNYFTHDHARKRAYRWGEDGILGFTDRQCRLCFALALWNGKDSILKERLYGLGGTEGNHGEDVKELYYYLDSSPTHAYAKALYKYPQRAFPYDEILAENKRRTRKDPEFEILDTGIFDDHRYFDVFVEYAKKNSDDILIEITVANRGPEEAEIHVLPHLWFRNTWSWGCRHEGATPRPMIREISPGQLDLEHHELGSYVFFAKSIESSGGVRFLFTENESNMEALWGQKNSAPYVKDAFHRYIVNGETHAINPEAYGTKTAVDYVLKIASGKSHKLSLRLTARKQITFKDAFDADFEATFALRKKETDEYYTQIISPILTKEEHHIQRQAYGGLLWTKQFYHYSVYDWIKGDPQFPKPPRSRKSGRNADWLNIFNRDVISVPDKWEYPWYAAWDLAFHVIPFAGIDPFFAKEQLILLLREWYMHPSGQIPAYEYNFSDVNPPVHASACWRVYKISAPQGKRDHRFLAECFHKLLLSFTWWVNRKDPRGKNLFSGGFLGLDNIGAFDRSMTLPQGGHLEQADGTAWMAFFCSTMLSIALELASFDPSYDGIASKFFEHFMAITDAINSLGAGGLWDETDGFYYDQLHVDGGSTPLKIRSLVGLIPLMAAEIFPISHVNSLPDFRKRMQWFMEHRQDLAKHISFMECDSQGQDKMLLAIPSRQRLERVLRYVLDEEEFLSPYGIRSLSKYHEKNPFKINVGGQEHCVQYVPGESDSSLFGGNSNWRGPIWFPLNFLLLEALEKYHYFYGESFTVEFPTGSGVRKNLKEVAEAIGMRLIKLFIADKDGNRPINGGDKRYSHDPHFKDLILFYEYFHGDTGRGVGASHQTGWTGLVAKFLEELGKRRTE
jgi:hypothetical protein